MLVPSSLDRLDLCSGHGREIDALHLGAYGSGGEDFESFDGIATFLAQQKVTPSVVDFRRVIQRGFYKPERV